MNRKFLMKSAELSKEEMDAYNNYLADWEENRTIDDCLIEAMISDAKIERSNHYATLYKDVDDLIKGKVISDQVDDMFALSVGNNDALTIMNSKAAIFDVRAINVELKPKFMPESDLENTEDLALVVNDILNESYLSDPKYGFVISDAIKYSRGYPMAVTLIGWDDNATLGLDTNIKGDITCENIPIENFWWDPSAKSLDVCEFVIIEKILPYYKISPFLRSLREHDLTLFDAWYAQHNQVAPMTEGNSELAPASVQIQNGAVPIATLYKKVKKEQTKEEKAKRFQDYEIEVYHVVGEKYIVGKQVYKIPYLPVSILKEQDTPDGFTGISSVMLAAPYLKEKIIIDQVCNNIALAQKTQRSIVSTASGIDAEEWAKVETAEVTKVFESNDIPSQSVYVVPSPQIGSDILQWRTLISDEINKAINTSDVANGADMTSKLSGAAVQNAVQQATIKENTSVVELEKYLVRFIRIMLAFMKTKFGNQKEEILWFRAPNNDTQQFDTDYSLVQIDTKAFQRIDMDVSINAELLRTSVMMKQQQDLVQLYQMELQYKQGQADLLTLVDIVKTMNFKGKARVIKRIKEQSIEGQTQKSLILLQGVNALAQISAMQGQDMDTQQAVVQIVSMMQTQEGTQQVMQLISQANDMAQQQQQQEAQQEAQMGGMLPNG